MKKLYIIPETKISEFKGQEYILNKSDLYIDDGDKADDGDALSGPRGEDWGNLWN